MTTIECDFIKFSQKPAPDVMKSFKRHVDATGRPETFSGSFKGRINKDEPFIKLADFTIEKSKRGDDTKVDCPMCNPNKYLTGLLVWFPQKQFIAAIGHCCANKENRIKAERQFEREQQIELEQQYLIAHIPLVPQYISAIESLLPAAKEAVSLYKKFRAADNNVWEILLPFKKRDGRLYVEEEIEAKVLMDNSEVAGKRGRHQDRMRTVEFGKLQGMVVLGTRFNPADELAALLPKISPLNMDNDEYAALSYVAELNDEERQKQYKILSKAPQEFGKIKEKIAGFSQFFSADNLSLINNWGQHLANATPLSVTFQTGSNGKIASVLFHNKNSSGKNLSCKLMVNVALWDSDYHLPFANLDDPIRE